MFFQEDLLQAATAARRSMLKFSGRDARMIRPALAGLLDERSGDDTESALPFLRAERWIG